MMPAAYYNEIDPFAAQWLRNLIAGGHIAPGEVDERSIEDVTPDDLRGFTQCHFFAGIGVWSHSLRLAGWPDDKPVWTGSCPCQPFSAAGKGDGFADERHLWPHFFHLISERRPQHVFGEQVASGNANTWFDLVQADLEGVGYAFGLVPFTSAGIGAPHIRERAYWVAHSSSEQYHQCNYSANERRRSRNSEQNRLGGGLDRMVTPQAIDGNNGVRAPRLKKDGKRDLLAEGSYRTDLKDIPYLIFSKPPYEKLNVSAPLRLTVFGEMRTGSYVEMANGVQLNPAHSRWLMGLPRAWDESSPGWQEWQAATASADSKAMVMP